jgi:hypothetical protein
MYKENTDLPQELERTRPILSDQFQRAVLLTESSICTKFVLVRSMQPNPVRMAFELN